MQLSDKQRLNWLRLIRSENVGPATFRQLINRFGSAAGALMMLPELSRNGGMTKPPRLCPREDAEAELDQASKIGCRFIALGEDNYPTYLRIIDGPPPLLAVKGNAEPASRRPVAMVGSRNASIAGIRFARKIATELGAAGRGIVSGLARGIDRAAHEGSLATGTVAVLAGGLDQPYPPDNLDLFQAIPDNGGFVVSEMPFGWEPRARDFPRRNRLIAGMALGLVVIEAAKRSGSLISARLANEMGRLVFAVPGSPLDPRSEGSNGLLKNGATLVTCVEDILEALEPLAGKPVILEEVEDEPLDGLPPPSDDERAVIVSALSPTPVHVDDIIQHTGLSTGQIALVLLELQLAGRVERHSGGTVSLVLLDR
jgi:DNA processing protein